MLAPAGGECALSGSWLERLKSNPASAGLAIGVISCRGVDTIFEDWIRLARIGAGCRAVSLATGTLPGGLTSATDSEHRNTAIAAGNQQRRLCKNSVTAAQGTRAQTSVAASRSALP